MIQLLYEQKNEFDIILSIFVVTSWPSVTPISWPHQVTHVSSTRHDQHQAPHCAPLVCPPALVTTGHCSVSDQSQTGYNTILWQSSSADNTGDNTGDHWSSLWPQLTMASNHQPIIKVRTCSSSHLLLSDHKSVRKILWAGPACFSGFSIAKF